MSLDNLTKEPECSGYHSFPYPTYSGYSVYEVYKRRDAWYWSEYDEWSNAHVGFESGPFDSSNEAYRDALKQNGFSINR